MQESSLHSSLKDWYAQPGDSLEAPVEGFLIDIVRGELLIEIQTRNFTAIKPKLIALLDRHPVRLVHPIARERWIVRLPAADGFPPGRRKSPRKGQLVHLFSELVRIPHLVAHPNLTLEVLLTREEEIRRNDGRGSWRRKGWSIADRRLLEVVERVVLEGPDDFRALLPLGLPDPFTARDLARALEVQDYLARRMVYCLRVLQIIEQVGTRGRAHLYQILLSPRG